MNCNHIHLKKIANMNPSTYRCESCGQMWDVSFAEVALPQPYFPTAEQPAQTSAEKAGE